MKELFYTWMLEHFSVLVPKQRGEGFLKVPYGHHRIDALDKISQAVNYDIFGLDGSLDFQCGMAICVNRGVDRDQIAATIMSLLEAHYGFPSREVTNAEFWENHPSHPNEIDEELEAANPMFRDTV